MHVHGDVALTVHRAVFAVIIIRSLSLPGSAGCSSGLWRTAFASCSLRLAVSLGGFFPGASRAWSIRASSSAIYASDAAATFTGFFLCLLALVLLCAESVYGIAPPTSPFSTHCRSIRLKICSAIWLPRNRRRRFRLTAVASGAFSVSSSPQNHYTRCRGRSPFPVVPAIWSHAGIPPAASETVPQHLSSPDPFCAYMRRRSLFPFWPLPHENIFRPLT